MTTETSKTSEFCHPDPEMADYYKHRVGNERCQEGWCDWVHYPKPCKCGGLIHADFGDESSDGCYWLYTKCDKCGEPEDD